MVKAKEKEFQEIRLQQPIIVEVQTPKSVSKIPKWVSKISLILSLLLFTSSLIGIGLFTTYQQDEYEAMFNNTPISILIDRPKTVSLRDPFQITVTLHNRGTSPINGTLQLNLNPYNFVTLGENGTNSFKVVDLKPNSSITQSFTFIPLNSPRDHFFGVELELNANSNILNINKPEWKIGIVGIPHLRATLTWILSGSGLLATLTGLFFEQIKRVIAKA